MTTERRQTDPHRSLLAFGVVGVVGVVRQRDRKTLYLGFDGIARMAGDHYDLVHPGTAERDQLPLDQGHALQLNQRLGDTPHAPTLASGEQHCTPP